jgi:hypothetical protein
MPGPDLQDVAKRELRSIDRRFLFWVALGVETATGSGASADDVDWESLDWATLRDNLDEWLDGLPADTPQVVYRWPVTDDLRLAFIAKPRTAPSAPGYRRQPSFNLADPDPIPPLHFADGETASFYELPVETVGELARGEKKLAIELASHRAAWDMLYGMMKAMGKSNTSAMNALELEVHAAALGLVEEPPDPLGSFDEGYRAVHGIDTPIVDDPRDERPDEADES